MDVGRLTEKRIKLSAVEVVSGLRLRRRERLHRLRGFAPLEGPFAELLQHVAASPRLRCLVQGCCHGRVAHTSVGIRYAHTRSRMCRLSTLAGGPVHPTPLYSILCNIIIAVNSHQS